MNELARTLLDAKDRANDRAFRSQLPSLLLRLSFYEYLPHDLIHRLLPLFEAYEKDNRVLRCLFYLVTANITRGSAGTPTAIDPSVVGQDIDANTVKAVIDVGQRLLRLGNSDSAVRRSAAYMMAAASRTSSNACQEVLNVLERLVNDVDTAAETSKNGKGLQPSSREDWELQHTVFGVTRVSGAPATATELAAACFLGIGSPDPAGSRHALALASEIAIRDPITVINEMGNIVEAAADTYESFTSTTPNSGEDDSREKQILSASSCGINLEDPFARLALARMCAYVLHSDHGSGDVSRGGASFWRMLILMAVRDPSDLVRFGALLSMTGATAVADNDLLFHVEKANAREENSKRQRMIRAWNLLASRASEPITIPGVEGSTKLMDTIVRLILLALSKPENAARFCAASDVASSLSESFMAARASATNRQALAYGDAERALSILSKELNNLVESPLRPVQRCSCIEALLYLQAGGLTTGLTPAKVAQVGMRSSRKHVSNTELSDTGIGMSMASAGDLQGALLTAVLKCSKANPVDASHFLGYISGVIAISPADGDLQKVIELWDASVAASKDGRKAALSAAMEAMNSPCPPSARTRPGAGPSEIARAARAEAGWSRFVATAAWWIGEHANILCDEYVGRSVKPCIESLNIYGKQNDEETKVDGNEIDDASIISKDDEYPDSESDSAPETSHDDMNLLNLYSSRNPVLSQIISSLHTSLLTSSWKLRVAAARALVTIAIRSGEPFRLLCYGILSTASASGGLDEDPLGVQGVTGPFIRLMDSIYATESTVEDLFATHGDDYEGWPPEIIQSLAEREQELRIRTEGFFCQIPPQRYSFLGPRVARILASAESDGGSLFASFLTGVEDESENPHLVLSDKNISVTKNKEVEDILSFGEDQGGSLSDMQYQNSIKYMEADKSRLNQRISTATAEKDQLVESLLGDNLDDPWSFVKQDISSSPQGLSSTADYFNAFQPENSYMQETSNQYGYDITEEDASAALQSQTRMPEATGTAPVVGVGFMLHTFIADASHPEELSIFEGDKVDILEESDDWMLVRDPSGLQGLVPTSYVKLQQLFGSGESKTTSVDQMAHPLSSHNSLSTDIWNSFTRQSSEAKRLMEKQDSIGASDQKTLSTDATLQEGALHNPAIDEGYQEKQQGVPGEANAQSPGMPAGEPWGTATKSLQRIGSGSPRKSGASTPTRFSPSWNASMSPTRSELGNKGNPFMAPPFQENSFYEDSDGVVTKTMHVTGVGSESSPGTGNMHRRMPSTASYSSHQRTLSAGSDVYSSMPGSPSQFPGPERGIVAPFSAEMEGELSVNIGDVVKVHSDSGGWSRVIRINDGQSGLIPSWAVGN